jgi:hypothetical protein
MAAGVSLMQEKCKHFAAKTRDSPRKKAAASSHNIVIDHNLFVFLVNPAKDFRDEQPDP